MNEINPACGETIAHLNKVLIKALRDLAPAGRRDEACTFSAQAWSLLRGSVPKEAQRHNGLLHYLTAVHKDPPSHVAQRMSESNESMDGGLR